MRDATRDATATQRHAAQRDTRRDATRRVATRQARKDHQDSKLRGYIWGRFAASFWLGISKTPPLFEMFEKRAAGMLWEHEYEYGYEYEYEYEYEYKHEYEYE